MKIYIGRAKIVEGERRQVKNKTFYILTGGTPTMMYGDIRPALNRMRPYIGKRVKMYMEVVK